MTNSLFNTLWLDLPGSEAKAFVTAAKLNNADSLSWRDSILEISDTKPRNTHSLASLN